MSQLCLAIKRDEHLRIDLPGGLSFDLAVVKAGEGQCQVRITAPPQVSITRSDFKPPEGLVHLVAARVPRPSPSTPLAARPRHSPPPGDSFQPMIDRPRIRRS